MTSSKSELDRLRERLRTFAQDQLDCGAPTMIPYLDDKTLIGIVAILYREDEELTPEARLTSFERRLATALREATPPTRLAKARHWLSMLEQAAESAEAAAARAAQVAEEERRKSARRFRRRDNMLTIGIWLGIFLAGALLALARAEIVPFPIGVAAFLVLAVIYILLSQ